MKRRLIALTAAVGMLMALAAVPVSAVPLEAKHLDVACSGGFLELHFVHNQLRGTSTEGAAITITFANAAGDTDTITYPRTHWNGGTVHYTISVDPSYTSLVSVGDNIDVGKMVISDAHCKGDKKATGF